MRFVDVEIRRARRNSHGRIILLRAVNVIWKIIVGRDAIKLRRRLILFRPVFAAVERNVRAAVVAFDHSLIIVRRNPQVVIVRVRRADGRKSSAAVNRFMKLHVQNINRVGVLRVGVNAV